MGLASSSYSGSEDFVLTLNMLVDKLGTIGFSIEHKPGDGHQKISWCMVARYSKDNPFEDDETLYCLGLDNVEAVLGGSPSTVGLLVLDADAECDLEDPPFPAEMLDRLAIVRNVSVEEPDLITFVQSFVQGRILVFMGWRDRLKSIIDRKGGIQELVDVTEHYIEGYMDVSDSMFGELACTGGSILANESPDASDSNLHVHAAENVAARGGWEDQEGVGVFEPDELVPAYYMTVVLRTGQAYAGHVLMVCMREPDDGLVDAFGVFANAVQVVTNEKSIEANPVSAFFIQLLGDHRLKSATIERRCEELGISTPGSFQLAVVERDGEDFYGDLLVSSNILAEYLPDCVLCSYKGSLIVIATDDGSIFDRGTENAEKLGSFCSRTQCVAFVSDVFQNIRHVHFAFKQAMEAKKYSRCIDISLRPLDDLDERRCFYFSEAFGFYFLDENTDKGLRDFNIQHTQLEEMVGQNTEREVSDLKLLYYYLFNERRATPTAEQLHMHRNNVLYRVKSIEKKYDLDLDDFPTRQRLLKCYELKIMESPQFRTLLI